ncbi:leucine-rich repeat protein [uncultured Eubacterium sp.]|uniref:leucine-rich repeat protein n=1 Tax=uncultured Eubacterium sp. TaxID=165185 RepID=UPI0028043AF4|nr:leucine-rich repeat protein [uncultured Eubacterium sp.]
MTTLKKLLAVFISALMIISALPVEAFAYSQDDYDFYQDLADGVKYTPIAVLPSNQDASGENEYCVWNYDASTKTVYINGENIESSHNAYSCVFTKDSGYATYQKGDAPLPLYSEIDDNGTTKEQYCTFDFEHLVIGKDTVNFNSHVSGRIYKNIKTVEFEEGSQLQTVGKNAFYFCPAQEYALPDTVTSIGEEAFMYSGILSFAVPSKVKGIEKNLFYHSSLESITFNQTETDIGDYAFAYSNIKEASVPQSVTSIGKDTFENTPISNVTLPNNLKIVSESMFSNCPNIKNIDFLPSTVTYIDDSAFSSTGITALDFTKTNITFIDDFAFSGCEELASVKLNEKTTYLSGFNSCPKLSGIPIPNNVIRIGYKAFANNPQLSFTSVPSSVKYIGSYAFTNTNVKELDLSANTELSLGDYAFCDLTTLEKIILPSTLRYISNRAFCNTALKSIIIPDGVETIYSGAFKNTPLSKVSFSSNSQLKIIDKYAFSDCLNLTKFVFPKSVIETRDGAFKNDVNLKTVIVLGEEGINASVNPFYAGDDNTKTYLTEIYGNDAKTDENGNKIWNGVSRYANVYGITLVPLEDYVETPDGGSQTDSSNHGTWANGSWQYDDSTNRLFVTGSGELTSTFKTSDGKALNLASYLSNKALTSIVLTEGITGVGADVFFTDYGIDVQSVSLPNTLTSIGSNAFRNIKAKKFKISANLSSIGANAFYGSNVNSFDLSDTKVEAIGNYAFANCKNLTSINLPKVLKTIGEGAFYSSSLKSVDVPQSVASIGKAAFTDCLSLWKVKINNPQTNIYFEGKNSANNAIGFDSKGNRITLKSGSRVQTECFVIIDAPVESKGFDYAEKTSLIFMGDDSNADVSGYVDYTYRIKWQYFADTKTLYVEHGYDMKDAYVLHPNNKGTFYTTDGRNLQDLNLQIDTLYLCSGVINPDYSFEAINPKYIRFSPTVKNVGGFQNCGRLEVLTIPQTVQYISTNAFKNCRSLKKISLGGVKCVSNRAFENCTSLKEIDYGNVTSIDERAFYYCSGIEEINIPSTVTEISHNAFYNCVGVKKIIINGEKRIGSQVFVNMPFCTSITLNRNYSDDLSLSAWSDAFYNIGFSTTGIELVVGDDVTEPDFSALTDTFGNKLKISSIYFGKNCAFKEVPRLPEMTYVEKITISPENKNMYVYEGNVYYGKTLVFANPNTYRPIIKDGTTVISSMAFKNSKVIQVVLPDSVTEIDNYAFYGAKNLRRVIFGSGLRTIGDRAFDGCSSLIGADIPSKVSSIGSYAFYECKKLETVILPTSISKVNKYTFAYCDSLKNVVVPRNVVSIGENAFACKNLQNIFVWRTTTQIDAFWLGFPANGLKIHTLAGSKALSYAQDNHIDYKIYQLSQFGDVCDAQIDSDGKYVDICKNGHGRIEYLTVYDADCENDGYIIGVCEFCSELLDEIHKPALGHNYVLTADIPAGVGTKGVKQYTCTNCQKTYCEYTEPLQPSEAVKQYTVSGTIVIETGETKKYNAPVRRADIVIDGKTVASSDDDGRFSFKIETGAYTAQIKYAYGYTRTVGIKVENDDVNFATPISIVACDFNKDGKIDETDAEMFSYVMSTSKNDLAYLDYCDLNHDGYINAKDRVIVMSFMGTDAKTYKYELVTIQK